MSDEKQRFTIQLRGTLVDTFTAISGPGISTFKVGDVEVTGVIANVDHARQLVTGFTATDAEIKRQIGNPDPIPVEIHELNENDLITIGVESPAKNKDAAEESTSESSAPATGEAVPSEEKNVH